MKLERKVGDFATAAAAVQVTLGAGGEIERAGIGLTAVGPTPIKATDAERFLLKKKPGCGHDRRGGAPGGRGDVADGRPARSGRSTSARWRAC